MGRSIPGLSPATKDAVVSRLEDTPVRLALLFGSHVTGDVDDNSDIDIAVAYEKGVAGVTDIHLSLIADLTRILGRDDVDVVRLTTVDPRIAVEALKHGHLLVGSSEAVAELHAQLEDDRLEREADINTRISEAERAIEQRLEQREHG